MIKFYKRLFSWLLFSYVDDGGGGEAESWTDHMEDGDLKTALSGFESQDKFLDAAGIKAPEAEKGDPVDWREGLDDDLKKTADRFNSPEDALRSIQEFRKRDSQVRVPSKDASEEEVAKYRKATGIPENAEGYEFPEIAKEDLTEEIKVSRETWGKRFHEMGITKDQAMLLSQLVNDDGAKMLEAQGEADKDFAKQQEEALRSEWKGDDYEKNKTFANRAFSEIANRAGLSLEELTKIETKAGRFLMDDARMLKLFSVIGREMGEGTLGPAISESERDTVEDEVRAVRKQIAAAQSEGNSKRANQLFQKEQKLLERIGGKAA